MQENIIKLTGNNEGPISTILAGVHGNERCGIEAIEKLFPTLKIQKGTVYIGYGNPKAIEANVRYVTENLNRMFKPDELLAPSAKESYEYSRAQFLKTYLDKSDCLLDVHATLSQNGRRFIICEQNGMSVAKYLPFDLVVSGFDAVEPGGTDYYMNSKNKVGICIECGFIEDPQSTEIAEKSILAFLIARGHIDGELKSEAQDKVTLDGVYLTKTDNFKLKKSFDDFERIAADQIIGTDGSEEVRAVHDGFILFARNKNRAREEAFLWGHKKN